MATRVVSPHTVQAWLPSGFFVLRSAETDAVPIAAAVTCASGTDSSIWLASSTAFLRHIKLFDDTKLQPIELGKLFLMNTFQEEHFPNSDMAVSLDVGSLSSISSFTAAGAIQNSKGSCDCCFEVFGEKGYARVGTHDGSVRESFLWEEASSSLAIAVSLHNGRLRDAVVPRGFSSSALLTVSFAGQVRVASGSSYSGVRKRANWIDGLNDVLNMYQTPVFHIVDPGSNFMIIVGCSRTGVVLFTDKNKKLASSRFVLKGWRRKLNRYSLLVSEEEDCRIVLEELNCGHRTGFIYDSDKGRVTVDLDFDNKLSGLKNEKPEENHSVALRSLLQGIEDLGERERCHQVHSNSTEALISSYNSAFMFLTEWEEKTSEGADLLKDSCSISVDTARRDGASSLSLPDPLLGVQVYVSVSFKNCTGISIGSGWMLQLKVWRASCDDAREESSSNRVDLESKEIGKKTGRVVRIMTCPVIGIAPDAMKTVSFPVVIDSHAPLTLSVALSFHHPTATPVSDSPVDIEIKLLEGAVIDILDLSKVTTKKDLQDSSHEVLAASQLMRLFDDKLAEKQRGYPLMSRLEVPLTPEAARGILGLASSVNTFESALGADYTISIAPVVLQGTGHRKEKLSTCLVTLWGVPHVLPFVRAAILRRILRGTAKNSTLLTSIVIKNRTNIERWRRSLHEAADECLPSFRRAESRLVEALRMFEEIERGSIEHCFDGNDRNAMLAALQTAKGSYGMWRRQLEHTLWTPKGAADAPKQ